MINFAIHSTKVQFRAFYVLAFSSLLLTLTSCNSGTNSSSSPSPTATPSSANALTGQWQIGLSTGETITAVMTAEGKLYILNPTISDEAVEVATQLKKVSEDTTIPSKIITLAPGSSLFPDSKQSQPSTESQQGNGQETEAKQYVGSMNRAQQAFFIDNGRFSSALDALGLGIKEETDSYKYSVTMIDEKQMVQNVGLAKQQGLKSYTGIVVIGKIPDSNETTTLAVACESNQPTIDPPPQPSLSANPTESPTCPEGYSPLK